MLIASFVNLLLGQKYVMRNLMPTDIFELPRIRKPPDPEGVPDKATRRTKSRSNFRGLERLALLAALTKGLSMPEFSHVGNNKLRKDLRKHRNKDGYLHTLGMTKKDPKTLDRLRVLLEFAVEEKNLFDPSLMFHLTMDSGCSVTATPCKSDFTDLHKIKEPIVLEGVGGNIVVTQGGTVRYEMLNTRGQVEAIETFAYFNPKMRF
jgi:hypothetical protein